MTGILIMALRFYQKALSPYLGGSCRFVPSCSDYAILSLKQKGLGAGLALTTKRLLRCHPLGGHGFDPVEMKPR